MLNAKAQKRMCWVDTKDSRLNRRLDQQQHEVSLVNYLLELKANKQVLPKKESEKHRRDLIVVVEKFVENTEKLRSEPVASVPTYRVR